MVRWKYSCLSSFFVFEKQTDIGMEQAKKIHIRTYKL